MKAIIVSHGQPGDPEPQEQAIRDLAAQVAACDPGCEVVGATLAMPGALGAAVRNGDLVYPMFMAEGWFTGRQLPKKLAEAGAPDARVMRPFGTDPALPDLVATKAQQAAESEGWAPQDTTVLLTAHGSQVSQASYTITNAVADQLASRFARVVTGFVEQEPFVADAARGLSWAVHVPFFALRAEHVSDDLPEALDEAGFTGPRLDPIGLAPEVPALVAAAIAREISNLK
ncbi:cobalamin biosynthesis protein CbiX (plasmid) [Paracoccus sp. TK19116]|uniref:Cobalamin biosynthesis protein CbiX n=1 Tax=Paracoccus albicereus TaxID=2922394 RepID=A0ABT1MKM8_9RHOB|nr:CbiX/SirB N-terminal domain-containing protein [Paracoccus albicereus]MCQ0968855.1 cobalamin biosynthesis protein CbiX [Paracoccus albicereus]